MRGLFQVLGVIFFGLMLLILVNASKGIGGYVDTSGWFRWDYTGYIARQNNETERERIRQREETERAEEWNDTMRTVGLGALAAAAVIVWTVQSNRTKRRVIDAWAAQAPLQLPSQPSPPMIANVYINNFLAGAGEVVDIDGVAMIADHANRTLIPLDVAQRRLSAAKLLTGPTIDGA
jgi:hypothetical protein